MIVDVLCDVFSFKGIVCDHFAVKNLGSHVILSESENKMMRKELGKYDLFFLYDSSVMNLAFGKTKTFGR